MRAVRQAIAATAVAACIVVVAPAWSAAASAARPAAPAAPAVVLVNSPARWVCAGHKFKVGVWFQRFSGGSRRYRIAISGPRHRRFFYRHGLAPASHWRFWRVTAGRAGEYRIRYSGHRPGSARWTTYLATTRARRC